MFKVMRMDEPMEEKVKDEGKGPGPGPGNNSVWGSSREKGASQDDRGGGGWRENRGVR